MSPDGRWLCSIRLLHWLAAATILFLLALGFVMVNVVDDAGERFVLYQLHKSVGLLVLALMVGRIVCRVLHDAPAPIVTIPLWRRRAASSMHILLYATTIALTFAGYASVSTSTLPLPVELPFGLEAPNLLAPDDALSDRFKQIHHVLAAFLALCVVAHATAAFKHHLVDRDGTLRRMNLF